jgi:hypothetical protein
MIFVIGSAIVGLLAALMVTSWAQAKKQSAKPAKASKNSPKKREITSINLSEADMNGKRKLDYHLKVVKLACDFELIYIKGTPRNFGFGQKLFDHVTYNNGFRNKGVLMVAKRLVSQADNSVLANANNLFPRRVIIWSVGKEGSTHQSRISILRALQAFLVQTDNNKFGYAYIVNKESNLTPAVDTNLEPMDHYIHDMVIINLMCRVFEDTGSGWYAANTKNALDFFSGPMFPPYAIEKFGYPSFDINGGGYTPGFNLPIEDGA